MADGIDIWRTANLLIQDLGKEALRVAAERADAMLVKGDAANRRLWLGVLAAIRELSDTEGRGKSRH